MTSKRTLQSLTATAIVFALGASACGSTSDNKQAADDYVNGVPELAAVQMSITSDPSSEGVATEPDAVDPDALASDEFAAVVDAAGAGTPDLNGARAAVRDVNQAFRSNLQPIAAMVRNTPPTLERGDLRVWGPVTRGSTDFRFLMVHPSVHVFRWRLDARVTGSADSYSRVAAGEIAVGSAARRGAGIAGFDLTTLSQVDPTVTANGVILAGFAHGKLGTTLSLALKDFTRNPTTDPTIGAVFQEIRLVNGVSRVRLAYRGNLEGTATDAQELVLARVRHTAGVGGRSDVVAISGDVPDGHAWVVSQCWDAALQQGYRIVRDCSRDDIDGASCTVVSAAGDVAACAANLKTPEFPPLDPNQSMTDAENPNANVAPPDAMPEVTDDVTNSG
jgi:hypothetical protein